MSTNALPPVEIVPISRLFCSPANPRHNDQAVPHVAASIRRFGWQQPIVAQRTGEVIAGNTRLKAAQELGMTEVPVWWFDGTDLDPVAFGIACRRTVSDTGAHLGNVGVIGGTKRLIHEEFGSLRCAVLAGRLYQLRSSTIDGKDVFELIDIGTNEEPLTASK